MSSLKVCIFTFPGIEDIVIGELKEMLKVKGSVLEEGIVVCNLKPLKILVANLYLRSALRIGILLRQKFVKDLDDIYKLAKSIDFSKFLESHQTLSVECQRENKHSFISLDAERVVGEVILNQARSKGLSLKVDLNNPQVKFFIYIKNGKALLTLDTTGTTLDKRLNKFYTHPQGLNSILAYSLLRFSGWDKKSSLIDPFCGAGTILLEAYLHALNYPHLQLKDKLKIWNLSFLPQEEFKKTLFQIQQSVNFTASVNLKIEGCDISLKSIEGAKLNFRRWGFKIKLEVRDALKCNKYEYDYIVTNPPKGIGTKGTRNIELLEKFINKLLEYKNKWKNACIISPYVELFREFKIKKKVIVGNSKLFMCRYR